MNNKRIYKEYAFCYHEASVHRRIYLKLSNQIFKTVIITILTSNHKLRWRR